jgi:hypothetical protein
MFPFGDNNLHFRVTVDKEVRVAALGLVLAACTRNPEAFPEVGRRPLTVDMTFRGLSEGVAGLREAEALVAPLKPLAESVTTDPNIFLDLPTVGREVQTRPLGVVIVRAESKPADVADE